MNLLNPLNPLNLLNLLNLLNPLNPLNLWVLPFSSIDSAIRWLILAGGIASVLYVVKTRQPPTTSDFTIFYESTAGPVRDMYKGLRLNLNPPHFSLFIEPLTWVRMSVAAEIWRALNVLSLCGCLWWLATRSREKWSVADVGAVLAWAPFHHAFTLNQVTWIMWPMLMAAWWQWRQDKWTAGAIWFGLALSFKSFLGVFLLWLLLRRQFRAIVVALATAAAALSVGVAAYGVDAFNAWLGAIRAVNWTSAWTNASLRALLLRALTRNTSGAAPFANLPDLGRHRCSSSSPRSSSSAPATCAAVAASTTAGPPWSRARCSRHRSAGCPTRGGCCRASSRHAFSCARRCCGFR